MDKTYLQIANELGVSKQQVYRTCKRLNVEAHQRSGVMYINDVGQTLIKREFFDMMKHIRSTSDVHQMMQSDTVIDALKEQLKAKDEQLAEKDRQIAEKDNQINCILETLQQAQKNLDQAQQLNAADKIKAIEEPEARGLMRLFKRKKS